MATITIPNLSGTAALSGNELFPIDQGGITKK